MTAFKGGPHRPESGMTYFHPVKSFAARRVHQPPSTPSHRLKPSSRPEEFHLRALSGRPNNATPSLQPRYRAFDATTGCSAPAPRFGTLALAVGAACGLSLHVIGVTRHRFSVPYESLVELRAAYMPDAARAV